jgi:hypothetical protein
MRERRNDLEIRNEIPQIALQIPNSDRSPLYDVRYHARRCPSGQRMRIDVSRTIIRGILDLRFHLVEPDGIEPTTSCLQSTRSPS